MFFVPDRSLSKHVAMVILVNCLSGVLIDSACACNCSGTPSVLSVNIIDRICFFPSAKYFL